MDKKDSIYANELGTVPGFQFDERVVAAFPDMIQRSVPGYESVIAMTGLLAARYAKPNSNCYDLGCSLGASTLSIASRAPESCQIFAVDNSSAMINGFSEILKDQPEAQQINLIENDIRSIAFADTSFAVMNFTLQFIPIEDRLALLSDICESMQPGAALLVSEKIYLEDEEVNDVFIEAHHEFKKRQGYSDLEIAQKRQAIENVLIPETLEAHHERFKQAGFSKSTVWFQCLNFCSFLAVK